MLIIIGFLLFAGTAMDSTVLILMLTSILAPIAQQLNIDLVHFGIIMVLTLTIGLLTPPEGAVLFIVCTIFKCSLWDFVKEGWLFMLSVVVVVIAGHFLAGFGFMASESDVWHRLKTIICFISFPCSCMGTEAAFGRDDL